MVLDLAVIQDCAHGFGSKYKGKKLGSTKS